MMIPSLPIMDLPLHCVNQASVLYQIPAKLILAIALTERGKTGEENINKDKSFDMGIMQINTRWLPTLKTAAIDRGQLIANSCTNIIAGSWILAKSIAEAPNLATGIGNYHSHTPYLNQQYQMQVMRNYRRLESVMG